MVDELVIRHFDHIAILQEVLLHRLAVYPGAVRAVEILQHGVGSGPEYDGMYAADRWILQPDIVLCPSTQRQPGSIQGNVAHCLPGDQQSELSHMRGVRSSAACGGRYG